MRKYIQKMLFARINIKFRISRREKTVHSIEYWQKLNVINNKMDRDR
jgi:hypothetical protein